MYDILLKNGEILDGTGKRPKFAADIAITDGKISEVGANIPIAKARTTIDATNKLIAPGFIDIQNHSDSYWTLFDQPQQLSLISQGITTIIVGNCGSSLAPLTSVESIKTIQKWHNLAGINVNWTTFDEFLQNLQMQKLSVNVGSLVGHATLRRGLLGDSVRRATWDEIKVMDKLLRQSLDSGAFGLSMGLMYAHEVNSATEELVELSTNLKDRYLAVHLRSESSKILESLDEAIELATQTNVALKISHLKIRGRSNWHLHEQVLARIESAFHKGLDISFDLYPYDSSWSVLYTYLPKWAYEGGREKILEMINSDTHRKKILEFLKSQEYDYRSIIVATSEGNSGLIGKNISEIANNSAISEPEAVLNVLTACKTQVVVFDHNLSQVAVNDFLASPLSVIATDGAGYDNAMQNLVHPRCYGAIPKFLKWVQAEKRITMHEAIRKLTGEPARILGFKDRGLINKNFVADLVIFDPATISDRGTYQQPFELSTGIEQVIVAGKVAYQNQKLEGFSGKIIKA